MTDSRVNIGGKTRTPHDMSAFNGEGNQLPPVNGDAGIPRDGDAGGTQGPHEVPERSSPLWISSPPAV